MKKLLFVNRGDIRIFYTIIENNRGLIVAYRNIETGEFMQSDGFTRPLDYFNDV